MTSEIPGVPSFDPVNGDILPRASLVNVTETQIVNYSATWRGGSILHVHVPDSTLDLRQWEVAYDNVYGALAAVLRGHYRTFQGATFRFVPPGAAVAAAVQVFYRQPTTIDWQNAISATARVFIEEAA